MNEPSQHEFELSVFGRGLFMNLKTEGAHMMHNLSTFSDCIKYLRELTALFEEQFKDESDPIYTGLISKYKETIRQAEKTYEAMSKETDYTDHDVLFLNERREN